MTRTDQARVRSNPWSRALNCAFPIHSSASRQTLSGMDRAIALGLVAVSTAVLTFRAPVAFSKIWADDGQFIESGVRELSVGSLFTTYRGYLNVIPRIVAGAIVQTPAGWWAVALATAAIAATAGTACLTFLVARWYIPQRTLCGLLGISVPLLPALRTESINSAANQHFLLVYAAFWLYLAPPRRTVRTILRSGAVLLIGLSSPLMFVLIPLPIARVIRYGRKELPLLIATACAVFAQGSAHLFWSSSSRSGGGLFAAADAAADYGLHVFQPTFGGFHLVGARSYAATFGVVVAIAAAWLGLWWLRRFLTARGDQPENLVLARSEFLMSLSLLLSGLFMIVEVQLGGSSYRYAIAPSLFLCTFLAASASRLCAATFHPAVVHRQSRARRLFTGLTILGVSILVILGWARGFSASEYRRSGPTWSTSLASARSTCRATRHPTRLSWCPLHRSSKEARGTSDSGAGRYDVVPVVERSLSCCRILRVSTRSRC